MAINAKELKLGSWVLFSPSGKKAAASERSVQVTELLTKSCITSDKGLGLELFYESSSIKPIPLSGDILLACGFVNSTDVHWCVPSNDPSKSFEICVWSDHVSYTMSNHFHLILNSLHQLQNLYHALTGEEMEIKNLK